VQLNVSFRLTLVLKLPTTTAKQIVAMTLLYKKKHEAYVA